MYNENLTIDHWLKDHSFPKIKQKAFRKNCFFGFGFDYGVRPSLKTDSEETRNKLYYLRFHFSVNDNKHTISIDINKK